jgi:hypothetical protein
MDGFRTVPPPRRSSVEKNLKDDIFERIGSNDIDRYATELGYFVDGGLQISTAHGLSIIRCNLTSREDGDEFGILVYWKYATNEKETSFHIGERL